MQKIIQGRYEIKAVIGQGGMGVVYRAYDPLMKRDVAIKTLHDVSSQPVLDLFYRECAILKGIVHPNVIDILDMGDFQDEGVTKPYYVMPLLPGKTLYDLLHPTKDIIEPLTVDRAVEIIVQTSRGLHAAHERELLHRDVKPRNIFVIDEYSVKLIDFGVAHLLGSNSTTGVKGTLEYMSPEQLKMKPLSRRTDIFSLATVCYEILTGHQPFRRPTAGETSAAVVNLNPPLACNVNPSVPRTISQVIGKAMAKEPLSRFSTVAEFADALQRARRNEPLTDLFDSTESLVRLQRARTSFEQGDYQFCSEVLRDLEAEGQADEEIQELRRRVDEALLRQATASLYEAAERYFRTQEYSLALRKAEEILELDAHHSGAMILKRKVEDVLAERKVAELLHASAERIQHAAFTEARKILQDAHRLRPDDTRVRQMLAEVDSRQKAFLKQRQEMERLYQASQAAWVGRDISQALLNLERLAELAQQTPEPRDRITEYKDFYKVVRTEHDLLLGALEQARQKLAAGDFSGSLGLCGQYLGKYPRHVAFAALKSEVELKQEEQQAAFRIKVDKQLEDQPRLELQIQILEDARGKYPEESYYANQLLRVRELQAEVASILDAAQLAEDADDFDEALAEWEKLRSLYPRFTGLDEQVARLTKSQEQARTAAKNRWDGDLEKAIGGGDLEQAASLLARASAQFPGEFQRFQDRLDQSRERRAQARQLLSNARTMALSDRSEGAIEIFRKAYEADPTDFGFRQSVIQAIAEHAQASVDSDWKRAEAYLDCARALDPSFTVPKDVRLRIDERQQTEFIEGVIARAAVFEKQGDPQAALREIDSGLGRYARSKTLQQMRARVEAAQAELEHKRARAVALQRAHELVRHVEGNIREAEVQRVLEEARSLTQRYSEDEELRELAEGITKQSLDLQEARRKLADGDLQGARAIADVYLRRLPRHAGFLDVQAQLTERELQVAIEYMDEVNRRLLAESDLDRRVQILGEAQSRYAEESYYSEQLDVVRREQSLVHAIAEEAAALEETGQFKEALDQWNRLRAIYRFYPDLETHIARVGQRHEQALRETQARWTTQILQALESWDYAQALELINRADAEFPGEFREVAEKVRKGADLRMGAQKRISEAQDLAGKARWEESQGKLRETLALAPGDPVIAKQVLTAYAKSARMAIKTDWKLAEGLLQAASAVDASFMTPADLRTKIEERRRSEFIDQALRQSKQLQEAGDLHAATDSVDKALKVYPGDNRLSQRKAELEGDLRKIEEEHARRRALDELLQMEGVTRTMVASPLELGRIIRRAEDIARSHPKDKELYSASDSLREQAEALQSTQTLLQAGKLDEAESITDRMLQRFEKHSAFVALKQAIQDARAQAAADYMDEVTLRLGEVQDLGKREALLREAVGKYTTEPYYQQELDFVHEKQRLVADIVNNARGAEQAGHYEEALELWKRLRTVHRYYDGLDAEIERLGAALADRQSAARDELLAEAGRAIEERNFQGASEVLHRLETEIGPSVGEQCARLRSRMEAIQSAIRLAEEGGLLFADRRYVEGSEKFLVAARQVPRDRELVSGLAGELVRHAESIVDLDWKAAGVVVEALRALDSKHPALSRLRARIDGTRHEEAVARLLKESQAMLDSGDARSAEKAAMAALSSYPGDSRLTERLSAIRAMLAAQERRRQIEKALKELAALEEEAQAASPRRLKKALKEADGIAARNAFELEVRQRANAVKEVLSAHIAEKERKREPEKQGTPAVTGSANARRIWLGAGIAAAVALGVIFIPRLLRSERQIPVTITSDLAGATVSAGGATCVTPNCAFRLPSGRYKLTGSKDGYRTVTENITIAAGQPELKLPAFEPLPQVLQVSTNFESGRVYLDGRAAGDLRDGQFSLSGVDPARHTVRVTSGQVEFQTEWRSSIGESPTVLQPVVAKDVQATLVTSLGETATVTCNCGTQNVMLDGAPAGRTAESAAAATPMKNLKDGSHQLTFAGRSLVIEGRPEPTLRLFLSLDRNTGTLVVDTGVDGARVYVNEKLYQRTTERGGLRIPLDVGQYSIRVEKDGYRSGASQVIGVQKGEEKRVAVLLTPVPAVLEIAGALPGAKVRIDGSAVGDTDANGGFRAEVQPGNHVVELTKDEYTPARFSAQFAAGRTMRPDRAQFTMSRVVRQPDPVQIEAQDWERIRTSNNVNDFDDFVRRHGDGAHAGDARARAAQLRQQQQVNAARQADQTAWDTTDRNRKASLQDYLSRFGNGTHAQEARGLIAGIDKQEADRLTAERAKEQKDKEQKANELKANELKANEQKANEQKANTAAEEQAITRVISAYESAYNAKDLKALQSIWSGMPKATVDAIGSTLKNARSITFQLRPLEKPETNGNSATVNCARSLSMTVPGQRIPTADDRVRVTLERTPTGWVIRSMTPY